jgi:hypothetical protein
VRARVWRGYGHSFARRWPRLFRGTDVRRVNVAVHGDLVLDDAAVPNRRLDPKGLKDFRYVIAGELLFGRTLGPDLVGLSISLAVSYRVVPRVLVR